MNEELDGSFNIERCDGCDLLPDDAAAMDVAVHHPRRSSAQARTNA